MDEKYKNSFSEINGKELILKKQINDKYSESTKNSEKIEKIEDKNEKLISEIYFYIQFENDIEELEKIEEEIINYYSNQKQINFQYEEKRFNKILKRIKEFGGLNMIENQINPIIDKKNENFLEFKKNQIALELDIKEASHFEIKKITIENKMNRLCEDLSICKDNNKSQKNINFRSDKGDCDSLRITPSCLESNEKRDISVTLHIDKPIKGETYKLFAYLSEKN